MGYCRKLRGWSVLVHKIEEGGEDVWRMISETQRQKQMGWAGRWIKDV